MCEKLQSLDFTALIADANAKWKSLVFVGPAGCGKTTAAKLYAPKPALFVTHLDILKQFRPEYHKSIIFDDISFAHLPRETNIFLADRQDARAIHIRYGVATIPAGIFKWFTGNRFPFQTNDSAIERRIEVFNLNE